MSAPANWSMEDVRRGIALIAGAHSEWAGIPIPLNDQPMVIHKRYPFAELFRTRFGAPPSMRVCTVSDVEQDGEIRNEFVSVIYKCRVTIFRTGKKFRVSFSRSNSAAMLISTCGASYAWDINAEVRAMSKLQSLIPDHLFKMYVLTGMFMETSKRSGVIYLFRRLRPTVAITASNPDSLRILCTLCGHSIGYYSDSWAGALCPTDDVISHLLLMRADEHFFWRTSSQHAAWEPESGL